MECAAAAVNIVFPKGVNMVDHGRRELLMARRKRLDLQQLRWQEAEEERKDSNTHGASSVSSTSVCAQNRTVIIHSYYAIYLPHKNTLFLYIYSAV